MTQTLPSSQPQVPVFDVSDLFNYIKAWSVYEMAKAQKVLQAPHKGDESDIEKITSQGSHSIASNLYDVLTIKTAEAIQGIFDLKNNTGRLIEDIQKIDPFLVSKVHYMTATRAQAPVAAPSADSTAPAAEVETDSSILN